MQIGQYTKEKPKNIAKSFPEIVLSAAEGGVGTEATAVAVIGGTERNSGVEDVGDGLTKQLDETVSVDSDVVDVFAANHERGIVIHIAGMLDEKHGWTYGLGSFLADDVAVEEGLEVIVAVIGNLGWIENGINVGQWAEMSCASLIVDDAYAVFAADGV